MDLNLIFVFLSGLQLCLTVLISSPFDNFRIECPQKYGAQRISIKMAESEGRLRQDTVFSLSCNPINEIYPWERIPQGVQDLEREDCHYTGMFDPIMDTNVSYTCAEREYIAGISRVTDTRIQMMCCRLRTRDETNCVSLRFGKPFGTNSKAEIQLNGKLINAFGVEQNLYKIRFCDLVPRAISEILADVKTTTMKPVVTSVSESTTTTKVSTTTQTIATSSENDKLTTKILTTEPTTTVQTSKINTKDETKSIVNQELEIFTTSSTQSPVLSTSTINTTIFDPKNSIEVTASVLPKENMFPSDKDYENIEEAESELMSTIAEMMKAKKIAVEILAKVKASGVKQQAMDKQQEMAEEILKEIENQNDPNNAEQIFKESIEMLNELAEAKKIMSAEEFTKEVERQNNEKEQSQTSFERRKAEDSDEMDVFEEEILPSAKITPPPPSIKKQRNFKTTRVFLTKVDEVTTPQTETPELTKLTTETKILTTTEPFSSTTNELTELSSTITPTFKLIKKIKSKKIISKPVVEQLSEEVLKAAANSQESRRAPIKTRPNTTLPPLDNFPSPPPHRRPSELSSYPSSVNRYPEYRVPVRHSQSSPPDFEEYDDLFRETPKPLFHRRPRPAVTTKHPVVNYNAKLSQIQPYVDEDTETSPFEEENRPRPVPKHNSPPSNEIFETDEEIIATANPKFRRPTIRYDNDSPFEVRRAPLPRGPALNLKQKADDLIPVDVEEAALAMTMPVMDDKKALENSKLKPKTEIHESTKDAVKIFAPANNQPMELNDEMLQQLMSMESVGDSLQNIHKNVETLVPMTAVDSENATMEEEATTTMNATISEEITATSEDLTTTTEELSTTTSSSTEDPTTTASTTTPTTTTEEITEEPTTTFETTPSTTPYDPATFYHTVPIKKQTKKEKYLTFCTKDLAIRDANNMVVACGDSIEVWYPPRCPVDSACFYTEDSTFRICCPISKG
uniref:Uncharacterized protein n=1 Tax=Panagrolaimus sp. JU765 TaxID=591449 RepID=A0AC34PWN8_9BILA